MQPAAKQDKLGTAGGQTGYGRYSEAETSCRAQTFPQQLPWEGWERAEELPSPGDTSGPSGGEWGLSEE